MAPLDSNHFGCSILTEAKMDVKFKLIMLAVVAVVVVVVVVVGVKASKQLQVLF